MANHIEIIKENIVASYKFRSNPRPPRPQPKNRGTHGAVGKQQIHIGALVAERRKNESQPD